MTGLKCSGPIADLIRCLGLNKPVGAMVDPAETIKFLEFLPPISWNQTYVILFLVRSKGMKEKYGFKGTDHGIEIKVVPGYLQEPKLRLYLELRRLAVQMSHSDQLFLYERHLKDGSIEYYRIPPELMTLMVSPNPADWTKAGMKTVNEFVESLRDAVMNPQSRDKLVRRLDVRFRSNAMKYTKHIFHMIDIDNRGLVNEIAERVHEILGYYPAMITTPNGAHLLIKVSDFDPKTAKKWFNIIPKYIESFNEKGKPPIVEYKKNFQEPVPGVLYRGFVPKFYPQAN